MISTVLTWRESRVFRYICAFTEEHGYAPTIREIGDAAELASTSSVSYVLSRLERKGYITRLWGRQAMTISPAHAGKITVSRDDVAAVLKLLGGEVYEIDSPMGRLASAAGLL